MLMSFWQFWKPSAVHSDEYETLCKRWVDVEQRLRRLELNESDMRDKVLRKLQRFKPESENDLNNLTPKSYKRLGGKAFNR
jgi:hypothetical protein